MSLSFDESFEFWQREKNLSIAQFNEIFSGSSIHKPCINPKSKNIKTAFFYRIEIMIAKAIVSVESRDENEMPLSIIINNANSFKEEMANFFLPYSKHPTINKHNKNRWTQILQYKMLTSWNDELKTVNPLEIKNGCKLIHYKPYKKTSSKNTPKSFEKKETQKSRYIENVPIQKRPREMEIMPTLLEENSSKRKQISINEQVPSMLPKKIKILQLFRQDIGNKTINAEVLSMPLSKTVNAEVLSMPLREMEIVSTSREENSSKRKQISMNEQVPSMLPKKIKILQTFREDISNKTVNVEVLSITPTEVEIMPTLREESSDKRKKISLYAEVLSKPSTEVEIMPTLREESSDKRKKISLYSEVLSMGSSKKEMEIMPTLCEERSNKRSKILHYAEVLSIGKASISFILN